MGGGGAERVVSVLANGLVSLGDTVEILTFIKGESFYPLDERVILSDCKVKRVSKGRFRKLSLAVYFPKVFFIARKKIKRGGYDAVVSFLKEADLTVYYIKKTGVKFKWISSERNDPTRRKKSQAKRYNRAYGKAELLVCQGERVKDYYENFSSVKAVVIPNPLEPSLIKERENANKTVVSVGRLFPQKNFPLLINAFCELHSDFPEYKLVIYGEGNERENLEKLIGELGASEYVSLPGAVKDVGEKIKSAELFVMSSDYEGFPNALAEAAAMGLPSISTDFSTGAAREILPDDGAIVPVGEKEGLKAAIKKMLTDKKYAKSCGENNRKNAEKFYSTRVVGLWREAIEGVIKADEQNV